jgi:rRNA-processing protein FCF1
MFTNFHHRTGTKIVVDANLLLLLLIGTVNKDYIEKFKRTSMYTKNDYNLLVEILKNYSKIITTPNILTEVNNFTKQAQKPNKNDVIVCFSKWLSSGFIEEEFIESRVVCNDQSFFYLGLTDTSIIKLSKERLGVITKDKHLFLELDRRQIPVINFSDYMERLQKSN